MSDREQFDAAAPSLTGHHPQLAEELTAAQDDPHAPATTIAYQPREGACASRAPEVPGYEVLGVLGRGGMGVVYKARQAALKRVVALKMIVAAGHAGSHELARFRTEAEAVARLQHPNIVQIHEVGEGNDGLAYLALEYVEGGSLAQRLAGAPQPPVEAARLVETLARAVHYAHERGVVHRDLKPANVLLAVSGQPSAFSPQLVAVRSGPSAPNTGLSEASGTSTDSALAAATPKIADFGLAKQLDQDSGQTHTGAVLGTPSYMAPEQAAGRVKEVGPAADVYALGAILYEMLTGRPPFKGATMLDTLEQVRSLEPVPPARLQPKTPADLERVCLKCLQKEPGRRYPTAEALAEDLGRFLRGEPVVARPVGRAERAWRWARRRPAVAAAYFLAVLVATLGAAGGTATWLWRSAETSRRQIEEARQQTERALTAEEQARRREEAANERLEDVLYTRRVDLAHRAWLANDVATAERLLADCARRRRRWEWGYVDRLCASELLILRGRTVVGLQVAFSPDGKHLAVAGGNYDRPAEPGEVIVWDAATGAEVRVLRGHRGGVFSVAYSADGRRLATAGGDGVVKLWDTATGAELRSFVGHAGVVRDVAFSPDGARLASAGADRTARLWDADTGKLLHLLRGHTDQATVVAFSPDGRLLASGSGNAGFPARPGEVRLWDAGSGKLATVIASRSGGVFGLAFDPHGKFLAYSGDGGSVVIWDVQKRERIRTLHGEGGGARRPLFYRLALSPDGRRVAAAGLDYVVRVWDLTDGNEVSTLRGHRHMVAAVAFSPDGTRLASAGADGTARVYDASRSQEALALRGHKSGVRNVAFSPDETRLATAGKDGTVRLWNTATGQEIHTLRAHTGEAQAVAFSPDGSRLASGGVDGTVRLWDAATGAPGASLPRHGTGVRSIAFSPDGSRIASAARDGTVKLWDADNGREALTLAGHGAGARCVVFRPDGKALATAGEDGHIRVWDLATGQEILRIPVPRCLNVAYSPDGELLAGGAENDVVVWDARDGRQVAVLRGHLEFVFAVAFHPRHGRLVSCSQDHTVRVWDPSTGVECLVLQGHNHVVGHVAFSRDGRRLASAAADGPVLIWDAGPAFAGSAAAKQ